VQDGLIRDEQAPTGWQMASSMINLARPHSIFR
jgi:hypothetical protein